jgi:hypothetical protein
MTSEMVSEGPPKTLMIKRSLRSEGMMMVLKLRKYLSPRA